MNPDTIRCVWTGEFDLNTLRVDGEIFESGKKKLRIQKCLDMCGRGLSSASSTERGRRRLIFFFFSFRIERRRCIFSLSTFLEPLAYRTGSRQSRISLVKYKFIFTRSSAVLEGWFTLLHKHKHKPTYVDAIRR